MKLSNDHSLISKLFAFFRRVSAAIKSTVADQAERLLTVDSQPPKSPPHEFVLQLGLNRWQTPLLEKPKRPPTHCTFEQTILATIRQSKLLQTQHLAGNTLSPNSAAARKVDFTLRKRRVDSRRGHCRSPLFKLRCRIFVLSSLLTVSTGKEYETCYHNCCIGRDVLRALR